MSAKRQRVATALFDLMSDDLLLFMWTYLTTTDAVRQQTVCSRFRSVLTTRNIPRNIRESFWFGYDTGTEEILWCTRYRFPTVNIRAGVMLPPCPHKREKVLGLCRSTRTMNAEAAAIYNHAGAMQLSEWLHSARTTLTTLNLPIAFVNGGHLGFGHVAWQTVCLVDFRALTSLDLGTNVMLSDSYLFLLRRSSFIGGLTHLTLSVDLPPTDPNYAGFKYLLRACTSLTTLVIGFKDATYWRDLTEATKLESLTVICLGPCLRARPTDDTFALLAPLQYLKSITYRMQNHNTCSHNPSAAVIAKFRCLKSVTVV